MGRTERRTNDGVHSVTGHLDGRPHNSVAIQYVDDLIVVFTYLRLLCFVGTTWPTSSTAARTRIINTGDEESKMREDYARDDGCSSCWWRLLGLSCWCRCIVSPWMMITTTGRHHDWTWTPGKYVVGDLLYSVIVKAKQSNCSVFNTTVGQKLIVSAALKST